MVGPRPLPAPPLHASQTEPPKYPKEINDQTGSNRPKSAQSPVRNQTTPTAKTPRNRAFFRVGRSAVASSLCSSHLRGGPGETQTSGLVSRIPGESRSPNSFARKSRAAPFLLRLGRRGVNEASPELRVDHESPGDRSVERGDSF